MNDVLIEKSESIQRCIRRIESLYDGFEADVDDNYDRQDALVLNILRACESSIDAALHLCKNRKLGTPNTAANSFSLLADHQLIASDLAAELARMVGFRNIAVHAYREMSIEVLHLVARDKRQQLADFSLILKQLA